jgi:hypothetical protein
MKSPVPFLAMRYSSDPLCPAPRLNTLRDTFAGRVATIELDGEGHSTLGASFNPQAFSDAVGYLRVRLGVSEGPYRMARAMFQGRSCEMTAGGWRAV